MERITDIASPARSFTGARQIRWLGVLLGVMVGIGYYGFLVAGAVIPQTLASAAVAGVPWSFLLGAALLVLIVCATGIYTLVANASEERA